MNTIEITTTEFDAEDNVFNEYSGFESLEYLGLPEYAVSLYGDIISTLTGKLIPLQQSNGTFFYRLPVVVSSGTTIRGRPIDFVRVAWAKYDIDVWMDSPFAEAIRESHIFYTRQPEDLADTGIRNEYGGKYLVDRYGCVWNTRTLSRQTGRINSSGYYLVNLGKSHANVYLHRLVAEHFCKIPDELLAAGYTKDTLIVNHIDANKLNDNATNLEWVTHLGNMEHARTHNLFRTGISDETLEFAWKLLSDGLTDIEISNKTGIPAPTVSNIRRRVEKRYDTPKYVWREYSNDAAAKEKRHREIIGMFNQGTNVGMLCAKFNTTEGTIRRIFKMHPDWITRKIEGHPRKVLTQEQKQFVFDNLVAGKSNSEIAQALGVTDSVIGAIRARRVFREESAKYVWSKSSISAEELAQRKTRDEFVIKTYTDHPYWTITSISKYCKVPHTTVRAILSKAGLR